MATLSIVTKKWHLLSKIRPSSISVRSHNLRAEGFQPLQTNCEGMVPNGKEGTKYETLLCSL